MNSHSEEVAKIRMELHHVFDCQSNNAMSRANAATTASPFIILAKFQEEEGY